MILSQYMSYFLTDWSSQQIKQTIGRSLRKKSHQSVFDDEKKSCYDPDFNVVVSPFDEKAILQRSLMMLKNDLLGLADTTPTQIRQPLDETIFYSPENIEQIWNTHQTKLSLPTEFLSQEWFDNCRNNVLLAKACNGTLIIPIYHPYYRHCVKHMIEKVTSNSECVVQSIYIDYLPPHEDNKLIYHYECKKYAPASLIQWRPDYNSWGGIHQMQARCHNCSYGRSFGKFLSDYENRTDKNCEFGYRYCYGKNALFVQFKKNGEIFKPFTTKRIHKKINKNKPKT